METKFIKRGVALGLTLVVLHRLISMTGSYNMATIPVFFIVTLLFLLTGKIEGLFVCGFTGLFTLIGSEILLSATGITDAVHELFTGESHVRHWLEIYATAFVACISTIIPAVVLTLMKFSIKTIDIGEVSEKHRSLVTLYGIITAATFFPLMLCDNAGIGVFIFAMVQLVMTAFIIRDKMRLLWFVPILVISLNPLLSSSDIWLIPNAIIVILLAAIMMSDTDNCSFFGYISAAADRILTACENFGIILKGRRVPNEKKNIIKRLLLALLITLPFALILIYMLSRIDMIFGAIMENFTIEWSIKTIIRIIISIVAALFLSAMAYSIGFSKEHTPREKKIFNTDLLIANTFLTVIVAIYVLFAVVQFKYLFSGAVDLPYDLTYMQYARRGFFELLALTGVNILMILIIVRITDHTSGVWLGVTKALLCGLCAVTIIMLASSFYRMHLYNVDDGLTRLRFMVFGFLIFEAISLLITFAYIIRPNFSITAVYFIMGIIYYCLLNVAPIDRIVAENQVERYLSGDKSGVGYVLTLSADAAPEVALLLESGDEYHSDKAKDFLKKHYSQSKDNGTFSFCISDHQLAKICEKYNITADNTDLS